MDRVLPADRTNKMTFSIVIPTYNSEDTIICALNSCVEQTLLPLEIIVVDDASRDSTVNLVENWMVQYNGNVKIFVEVLETNSGPSIARNNGWNLATGNYVAFLDADDWYVDEKLKVIVPFLRDIPDIVLLGHSYAVSEQQDKSTSDLKHLATKQFLIKNYFTTSATIIKRDIEEQFDESMRYTEDQDLFLRLTYKYNKTYYLEEELTLRAREMNTLGGQSANLWAMRKGEIKMYWKFCKANALMVLFPLFLGYSLAKHTVKYLKGSA